MSNKPIKDGQRITLIGPCGGGWGDPFDRDPEQVRADVLDDLVSEQRARDVYGVVLTDDLEVNEEETAELREERR